MKAYKIEILVLDDEDCGEGEVRRAVESNRHLNIEVMALQKVDFDWTDEHPLNSHDTQLEAYKELFKGKEIL